jgi:hypothetical protein
MGIYVFQFRKFCPLVARQEMEHQLAHKPGGAATSVPIAPSSYLHLSIYLSIMAVIVDDASSQHITNASTCTIH